jgi:mRNA interferase RelE/StbE
MYRVTLTSRAVKDFEAIPNPVFQKLRAAIFAIADNPRPSGSKKLKGREGYRIRVGDYRVIYEIKDDVLIIKVIRIGHRKEIYNK